MSKVEAGIGAYLEYLRSLRDSGVEYFLEGGQAVNFWAEYLDHRVPGSPIGSMRPFTSKDCDIWVSARTWEQLKRNPAVIRGTSPADGQLGILTLNETPPRIVDILSSVYGIDVKEYQRLQERALDDGNVRVLDPIHLFLSKCHCFLNLPQPDRQDERHVRMLAVILPEYLTLLIVDAEEGTLSPRDLLREIKLVARIIRIRACRHTLKLTGIDPRSLIPWSRLSSSSENILSKFARNQRADHE